LAYRNVVVIGASSGGIEALSRIAEDLPAALAAPVLVVVHISPDSPGYLPEILASRGSLPAKNAKEGEIARNGTIYVAPPDRHLVIEPNGRLRTPRGARENRSRPAVDPLFRSAALAFGSRVIGVVLSGGLDDGAAGLRGIKMCGGTTVVQDPGDAVVDSMPLSALRSVSVDYCRPVRDIGRLVAQLVAGGTSKSSQQMDDNMRRELETEVAIAQDPKGAAAIREFGTPSIFTCPECHGTLLRMRGERPLRFRCHTGHAFSAESLLAELNEATDQVIWNAIRSIQEGAMLLSHLADHWQEVDPEAASAYRGKARLALKRADLIRQVTTEGELVASPNMSAEPVAKTA
jgi:two-component system, chemotaxis family, protein-glutamate methylesterase/glutaminase